VPCSDIRRLRRRRAADDVLIPHETRPRVITALETLQTKREPGPKRKHGNIPL
jgi:propionyl-CoA carboxylase beta chain